MRTTNTKEEKEFFRSIKIGEDIQTIVQHLNNGVDINCHQYISYMSVGNALHHAVLAHRKDLVELLIMRGIEINATNAGGTTPLHDSIYAGSSYCVSAGTFYPSPKPSKHREIAQLLINHKTNINATDAYNRTPLYEAVRFGDLGMIELLLDNNADFTIRDTAGQTAFTQRGQTPGLEEFIRNMLKARNIDWYEVQGKRNFRR